MKNYVVLLAMLVAGTADAASFDCALARSRIENAICASPQVSRLDGELADAYQAALAKNSDPEAVKSAQRVWLTRTRNQCQDETCLTTVYQQRLGALRASASPIETNGGAATPTQELPAAKPDSSADASSHSEAPTVAASAEETPQSMTESPATPASQTQGASAGSIQGVTAAQATPAKSEAHTLANAEIASNLASSPAGQGEAMKHRGPMAFGVLILAVLAGTTTWHVARRRNATRAMSIGRGVLVSAAVFVVGAICIQGIFGSTPASSSAGADPVSTLDARLTGKWTTDQNVAPACTSTSEVGYTVRRADGHMDFVGSDGAVIASPVVRVVKAYDQDIGAATVTSNGLAPFYWVVQFSSDRSMTTMRVAALPETKATALQKLDTGSSPDFPNTFPSVQYRCGAPVAMPSGGSVIATSVTSRADGALLARRNLAACEPTEGKNNTGGCARYVDIPNDGRFMATRELQTSESGTLLVNFKFDSDVRTAVRSATVQCADSKSPDTSATYELDFGLPGMRLAAYYALPNFKNYAVIRGSHDKSGGIPLEGDALVKSRNVECRVTAVVVASDAEVQAVQADLHSLSEANAKAEGEQSTGQGAGADPFVQLQSAYAAFDARCQQIAGSNTLDLITQIREIRRLGGRPTQGMGSVDGQLAMLRSIGCAPR